MAKKRSEKSRYKSPSTGEYCTAAQYIAELMCQRMAEKENEGSLAYKFWNTDKLKNAYKHQLVLANRLVNKHDERAIIKALKSNRGSNIYSLRFPHLEQMIKKAEREMQRLDEKQDVINHEENKTHSKRKRFGKESELSKLRKLDNE